MLTALLLLALILVLLAIPLSLSFRVSRKKVLQGEVVLGWAFGLIRITLPLTGGAREVQPEEGPRKTKPLTRRRSSRGHPWALVRNRPFRRRILRFVSDLWRAFHKQNLTVRIRLGLGDPADTGQLWGVVGPVAALFANLKEARIELEPEFMEAAFELEGSGTLRFVPLHLLALVTGLMLSPSIWQGVRLMRQV